MHRHGVAPGDLPDSSLQMTHAEWAVLSILSTRYLRTPYWLVALYEVLRTLRAAWYPSSFPGYGVPCLTRL